MSLKCDEFGEDGGPALSVMRSSRGIAKEAKREESGRGEKRIRKWGKINQLQHGHTVGGTVILSGSVIWLKKNSMWTQNHRKCSTQYIDILGVNKIILMASASKLRPVSLHI